MYFVPNASRSGRNIAKHVPRAVSRFHLQTEYLRVPPSQHRKNNIHNSTKEGTEKNNDRKGRNALEM
jgi:hypothetical protein